MPQDDKPAKPPQIDLATIRESVRLTDVLQGDRLTGAQRQRKELLAELDRRSVALIAFACSCYQRRGLDPLEHEELCRYRAILKAPR